MWLIERIPLLFKHLRFLIRYPLDGTGPNVNNKCNLNIHECFALNENDNMKNGRDVPTWQRRECVKQQARIRLRRLARWLSWGKRLLLPLLCLPSLPFLTSVWEKPRCSLCVGFHLLLNSCAEFARICIHKVYVNCYPVAPLETSLYHEKPSLTSELGNSPSSKPILLRSITIFQFTKH